MATYVPTKNVAKTYTFVQYTSGGGVAGLETALQTAFPTQNVQVYADDQHATQALVVANAQVVFSVPLNNWVGFNDGAWAQYVPADVDGTADSVFTAYP